MKKSRAVIYVRLSKEDSDKIQKTDESESIRNQKQLLMDYAVSNDYEIVKVYSDDDESGLYDNRPGFRQMISDAEAGLFDVIIAKNQARFSRSMEHIEKYLHSELPHIGIRFIGVLDGTDTQNRSNKKARQINGLINEWYCEDLSENIKKVFRSKMEHGEYIGGVAPYGYIVDPHNHNHLVIDPYASEIVRKIFYLYLKGFGKAKIASMLTEEGVYIPTIYKREVLGLNYRNARLKTGTARWSYQTVHNILKNEMYIGNMVQHRYKRISYKNKTKVALPEEQWIRKSGTHEPIIDKNTWTAVQEQMKHRTSEINFTASGILSGKVYCGICGKPMCRCFPTARSGKDCDRSGIFICSTYKKYGNSYCVSNKVAFTELSDLLQDSVKSELRKILASAGSEYINVLSDDMLSKSMKKHRQDSNIYQLNKISFYRKSAFEQFAERMISKNQYENLLRLYDNQEGKLKSQIRESEILKKSINDAYRQYEKWLSMIINGNYNVFEENEIIGGMIEKIIIVNSTDITLRYRFSEPETGNIDAN